MHNAVHYVPQGGNVTISFREQSDRLILCVADTGPGIPEAERTRVFDPFYRVLGTQQTEPDWDWPFAKLLRIVMAVPLR